LEEEKKKLIKNLNFEISCNPFVFPLFICLFIYVGRPLPYLSHCPLHRRLSHPTASHPRRWRGSPSLSFIHPPFSSSPESRISNITYRFP